MNRTRHLLQCDLDKAVSLLSQVLHWSKDVPVTLQKRAEAFVREQNKHRENK